MTIKSLHTVETLIRAAALKVFSRNFGQNLLSKNWSYLRLLFKGGCYLSAALINVITVNFLFLVKIKVDVVSLETEAIQVVRPLKLFMDHGLVQVGNNLFQRKLTMTRNTMSSELVRIVLEFLH